MIILASTIEGIITALHAYQTEATKLGLKVNWTKTKVMHIVDDETPPAVEINNEALEVVSSFL